MSGCYFFSQMFALLTAPGFVIWTPTAITDNTILLLEKDEGKKRE